MIAPEARPVVEFTVDSLRVVVHEDRAADGPGRRRARWPGRSPTGRRSAGRANVVFAAAPSQDEFLAGAGRLPGDRLVARRRLPHGRVPRARPRPPRLVPPLPPGAPLPPRRPDGDRLRLIPGEEADRPLRTCLAYERPLLDEPTDIVCAGIGENGHLAFNDPPVADFLDPVLVKVVRLDAACRDAAAQRRLLRPRSRTCRPTPTP